MGSPDKAAVLQKVIRFKQLDNRRIELGALSPLEEKEWSALKLDIGRVLFREKFRAGQAEKRAAIRVPTNLHATFKDKEAFRDAYIKNISGGGVYIETEAPFDLYDKIELLIDIHERPKKQLKVKGRVVWVNSNPSEESEMKRGVGVQFADMNREDLWTVYGMVHKTIDRQAERHVTRSRSVEKSSLAGRVKGAFRTLLGSD